MLARRWIQLSTAMTVASTGCGVGGNVAVQLGKHAQEAAACDWGAGTTQPEGWTFTIPITLESGPRGVQVDCGPTDVDIGVENDGADKLPAAPPSAAVDRWGTSISIWDVGDGTTITNGAAIPGRVNERLPFGNGCYKFRVGVTAFRTYNLISSHIYQIECRADYVVTRFKMGADGVEVDRVSELAFGFGSNTVTIEY